MAGFVMLHNRDRWPATDEDVKHWDEVTQGLAAGETRTFTWSMGSRKSGITVGDWLFLLQTNPDAGIVTVGQVTSDPEPRTHWDGTGRETWFVGADWRGWAGENPLPREVLEQEVPTKWKWRPRTSAMELDEEQTQLLLETWYRHMS